VRRFSLNFIHMKERGELPFEIGDWSFDAHTILYGGIHSYLAGISLLPLAVGAGGRKKIGFPRSEKGSARAPAAGIAEEEEEGELRRGDIQSVESFRQSC